MTLLEAYKITEQFRNKVKDLKEKEKQEAIDKASDEVNDAFTEMINGQIKINYVFDDDDRRDYTEDVKELKKRVEDIRETINSYNQSDLDYVKESLTENDYILQVLAHCIKDTSEDLDEDRLNDLIKKYNKINNFINNDDNYETILELYGDIVDKDDKGFYKINNAIINKILLDNELNIDINEDDDEENDNIRTIKDAISEVWENKKEILDPKQINDLSEKQNGINFKQFIFCEEYIKRGKIKPTCSYLGISRNTAYLWLKDDNVQNYLKNRQDEIKRETDDTFIQTYRDSFNELNRMIKSNYMQNADKIKAIDTFLKHYENIERLKQPLTTYED